MRALLASSLVLLCAIFSLRADYPAERAEAMELFQAGKYPEAYERFLKLPASPKNEAQQADALSHAALCLQRMNRHAEAMDLAGQIASEPLAMASRIEILADSRQWAELLKISGGLDFSVWPDKTISPSFLARGQAHMITGQADAAESDFRNAEENTISPVQKARIWMLIAENFQRAGGDPQKALDAYAAVCELAPRTGGNLQRAHYARTKLLADQQAWDQALAEASLLEKAQNKDSRWICTAQLAFGYIFEKQGNSAKALASYREAAAVSGAPEELVQEAKTKIAALENAARGGKSPPAL